MLERCDLHEGGAIECRWAKEEIETKLARKRRLSKESSSSSSSSKGLDFEGSGVVVLDDHEQVKKKVAFVVGGEFKDQQKETGKDLSKVDEKERRKAVKTAEKEESSVNSTPSSSSTPIPPTRTITPPTPKTTSGTKEKPVEIPITKEEEDEEEDEEPGMFAGAGKFLLAGGMAGAGTFSLLVTLVSIARELISSLDSVSNGDCTFRSTKSLPHHFPVCTPSSSPTTTVFVWSSTANETRQDTEAERRKSRSCRSSSLQSRRSESVLDWKHVERDQDLSR